MNELADLCRAAAAAAAALEPGSLDIDGLRSTAVGLQQHIEQMSVALAKVLHEAENRRAWEGTGARSMADWLAGKTKSSYGQAKRKEQLGKGLSKSKELDEAVKHGVLSPDAATELVEAISNPPDGADVGELVNAAKGATPPEARDAAERWKQIHSVESEQAAARRRFEQRTVKSSAPRDGLVTTTVVLPVLENRQFHNALEHIKGQSNADGRTREQQMADALIALTDAYAKGTVTGGREKPSLLITIPAESMLGSSNQPGVTAHGDHIPAHLVRQMAGNALLRRVLEADGTVLDLGRTVRYATDDQYRVLVVRDGCCRFPGCRIPAGWCDVDHIMAWEHNGPSDLSNEWLLCRFHHTLKHSPGVSAIGDATNTQIRLADGTVIDCSLQPRRQPHGQEQPQRERQRQRTQAAA